MESPLRKNMLELSLTSAGEQYMDMITVGGGKK